MKAVITPGGLGTRIFEETNLKPKTMIKIGGMPVLWHIMKIYSHYVINDIITCCGCMGYMIKECFANYFLHMSNIMFYLADNSIQVHRRKSEPWKVAHVDTGEATMTGGRPKRIASYLDSELPFCLTYGYGVSDIDSGRLISFHKTSDRISTTTAVYLPRRLDAPNIYSGLVASIK